MNQYYLRMKSSHPSSGNHAFSMIELMVVIGIIVILAGILIGSLPGIQNRVNRNRVEAFIAELEDGLSKYQIDNGLYPLNKGTGDSAGIEGAKVLYKHLSGDFDTDGKVDFEKNEKIYVAKLDYDSNRNAKEKRSDSFGGSFIVIDSFGDPIRYLADVPNLPKGQKRQTRNPTYDLWSVAGTDPQDPANEAAFIGNWSAK